MTPTRPSPSTPLQLRELPRSVQLVAAFLLVAVAGCRSSGGDSESERGASAAEGSTAASAGAAAEGGAAATQPSDEPELEVELPGPPSPGIFFLAGLKGYTEPCGCTTDLLMGGIDRIAGYIRAATALTTGPLVLDAGDTFFEHASLDEKMRAQELRKTDVLVAALQRIGVVATVPGERDLANGLDYYLERADAAGMTVLASNLRGAGDMPIGLGHIVEEAGGLSVAVIGAVDPALFSGRDDVEVSDARAAVDEAIASLQERDVTILLFHGDIVATRRTFSEIEGVDFIVVGHDPRETDEVEEVGSAMTLEAYDQGRYVGYLKLVRPEQDATADLAWTNARRGSDREKERLESLIDGVRGQLEALPNLADGGEPPIATRLRDRLDRYRAELARISGSDADFEAGAATFYYDPVAMRPGYPIDAETHEAKASYNAALRELNMQDTEPPPPAPEGAPSFVGVERCTQCHADAHRQWETTAHARAIDTLVERDKQFDRSCIGCHVTGYEEPGGSSLGHLDGLRNVQCEACHGPGSMHASNPTLVNVEGGVQTDVPAQVCTTCHNTEHSTRFDYDSYRQRILGPGHGAPPQ